MGNAYLTNFYTNMKTIHELNLALKCYKQSKQFMNDPPSDMHYNMATVYNYLQDY